MKPSSKDIYEQRVNAAMDFVAANLGEDLQLEGIAGAAGFSPFHFHRIFSALVGETVGEFVARVRVERAAVLLLDQPDRTVGAIGIECGFGTSSAFARAFRTAFGRTPSEWRTNGHGHGHGPDGHGHESDGRSGIERPPRRPTAPVTVEELVPSKEWRLTCGDLDPATVEITTLPDLDVAYVRHAGPYAGDDQVFANLFGRLAAWAESTIGGTAVHETYAMYHDDPNVTDGSHLRVSACMRLPAGLVPDPPVHQGQIRGGTYVVAQFRLGLSDYTDAWTGLLGGWLPVSGFEPDNRDYFERFPSVAEETGKRSVEICVPVKKLSTTWRN